MDTRCPFSSAPGKTASGARVTRLLLELGFADIGPLKYEDACAVIAVDELKQRRFNGVYVAPSSKPIPPEAGA
jgi:hypothetical protein